MHHIGDNFECKGCETARTLASAFIVPRPKAKRKPKAATPLQPKTPRKPRTKRAKSDASTAKGEFDPFDL